MANRMKDSGVEWIGKIPEEWYLVALKYLITIKDGTHDTPQYVDISENSVPLITSKSIIDGVIKFEFANNISVSDYRKINKRSDVEYGDVIMPMIGTIGNSAIVDVRSPFSIKNVALFKTSHDFTFAKLLNYMLNSSLIYNQFDMLSHGGVLPFVSLNILGNIIVPVIPQDERQCPEFAVN